MLIYFYLIMLWITFIKADNITLICYILCMAALKIQSIDKFVRLNQLID